MTVFTPGKIILSGEHAIVQGGRALAAPVRAGVRGRFTQRDTPELRIHAPPFPAACLPLAALPDFLAAITRRHTAFLQNRLPVSAILQSPTDLLLAAAALAAPRSGVDIALDSELPFGSGLGSSAAVILTLLKGLQPSADPETLRRLAHQGEQFQHGRSSGLDVVTCLYETLVSGQNGEFHPVSLSGPLPPFRLYHAGKPQSTTGECVALVREQHPAGHGIWAHFETTTLAMHAAVLAHDLNAFREAVRANHALLVEIGVVPEPVQKAVHAIEAMGGAAKICGAGSIHGPGAGTVLVSGPDSLPIPASWTPLHVL